MTDASFTAAGYAILTEDDQNKKYTPVKKSYAPKANGSKTFTPSQLKTSIYAKEILAIYYAFKKFGHIIWGTPKSVFIHTENKSVTLFFQDITAATLECMRFRHSVQVHYSSQSMQE